MLCTVTSLDAVHFRSDRDDGCQLDPLATSDVAREEPKVGLVELSDFEKRHHAAGRSSLAMPVEAANDGGPLRCTNGS